MPRWRRATGATWRIADGALVACTRSDDVVCISAPGGTVWEELASTSSAAELVARLEARFTSTSSLQQDVAALLDDLRVHGLIEPAP